MNTRSHDFFLLRRPALSLNMLLDFNEHIELNPELFEKNILAFFEQSEFQDAIYLASPDLHEVLIKILDGSYQGDVRPICKTLYRYLVRMCSRPTPFGSMAGIGCGEISGEPTNISFPQCAPMQPKVQLSFSMFTNLSRAIASLSEVFPYLNLSCNTSLYRFQNVYRYVKRIEKDSASFSQHELESNCYVDLVIESTRVPASFKLINEKLSDAGLSPADAEDLVRSLFDEQILISEIEAGPIGENGLDYLIKRLEMLPNAAHIIKDLRAIKLVLGRNDDVQNISEKLRTILMNYYGVEKGEQLLLVNSVLNQDTCQINQSVVSVIEKELGELSGLSDRNVNPDIQRFCSEFFEKFQTRPIPLLEALDPKTGIGYGNKALCDPYEFEHIQKLNFDDPKPELYGSGAFDELRWSLYERSIHQRSIIINLTKKDLSPFESNTSQLSEGTCVMGKFITGSQASMDNGAFQFSLSAMGSAFNLLSRFCSVDPLLKGLVTQAISCEELLNPEVIYAEINHTPSGKEGNILIRPHLRKHEIPYLSASKTKQENQILPDDLYLCMPDGKQLILWSKSRGKHIIPRLTSAHNFSNGLPVYRFLCDLAGQSAAPVLNWDWGHLADKDFLPRIQYKHNILSLAQWNISLDMFALSNVDDIRKLLINMRVPRFTQITQADQLLLVDTNSTISMERLLSLLRKRSGVRLVEFLESSHQGFLREGEQTYMHEVIIPFKAAAPKVAIKKPTLKAVTDNRVFVAGSEWVYVKVYLSHSLTDQLIIHSIKPFCEQLLKKGLIEKWFFVRYDDPGHHLRVRLHASGSKQTVFEVIRAVCEELQLLLKGAKIEKFTIDSYQRELERYAQVDYALTETLFYQDTLSVCKLLELAVDDIVPKWQIALRAVNSYLNSVGYDLAKKRNLVGQVHASFHAELNCQQFHLYEMDKSYRTHLIHIRTTLAKQQVNHAIRQLDRYLQTVLSHCQYLSQKLADCDNPDAYVANVVHMFLNRLFSINHRKLEFVIYHYLKKYYDSVYFRAQTVVKLPKNTANQLSN
jgi:thiopeptide-type bacteriocin biosynthesis protein